MRSPIWTAPNEDVIDLSKLAMVFPILHLQEDLWQFACLLESGYIHVFRFFVGNFVDAQRFSHGMRKELLAAWVKWIDRTIDSDKPTA